MKKVSQNRKYAIIMEQEARKDKMISKIIRLMSFTNI